MTARVMPDSSVFPCHHSGTLLSEIAEAGVRELVLPVSACVAHDEQGSSFLQAPPLIFACSFFAMTSKFRRVLLCFDEAASPPIDMDCRGLTPSQ